MLAELAERISALGPRFQLPFQVLRTIEAQDGRKAALAFARAQKDLEFKFLAALVADATGSMNFLKEYAQVLSNWPPSARDANRLMRRFDKLLAGILQRAEEIT